MKIKAMASAPGQPAENETGEVNFRAPFTCVTERFMYFTYQVCQTNSSIKIPDLQTAPEIATGVEMALNFHDC